jgi:hypothetical protein
MKLLVLLIALVPLTLLRAFVFVKLWGWFIVTTFALPALSYPAAMGIGTLVGMLTMRPTKENDDDELGIQAVFTSISISLLAWFAGWIIQHWM